MLKGAIIGLGRMGITHLSILNSNNYVNIVAICDNSKTMLNIAKKYMNIPTYTDVIKLFETHELDFVVISTPSDSHGELISLALNQNCNVFVEKPFVLDLEEGRRLIERMVERNLICQVGYVNRFNEVFCKVKEMVDKDVIGNIIQFKSEMYGSTVKKRKQVRMAGKEKFWRWMHL